MSDPKHVQLFHIENIAKLQYFTSFVANNDDIRPLTAAFRINSAEPPTPDAMFFEGEVGDIILPVGFMNDWEESVKKMEDMGLFFNFPGASGPPIAMVGPDHPTNMDLVPLAELRAGKGWGILKSQPSETNWAFLQKRMEDLLPVAKLVFLETGRLPMTYVLQPQNLDTEVSIMSVANNEIEKERSTLRMASLVGYCGTEYYAVMAQAERSVLTQDYQPTDIPDEIIITIVVVHRNGEKLIMTCPVLTDAEMGTDFGEPEYKQGFGAEFFGRLTCLFDLAPRGEALDRCKQNYGDKLQKMVIPEEFLPEEPQADEGATILKFPKI